MLVSLKRDWNADDAEKTPPSSHLKQGLKCKCKQKHRALPNNPCFLSLCYFFKIFVTRGKLDFR